MRKTIVLGTILVLLQIPLLAYVLLHERTWGGPARDGALGVATSADGSVYVTGGTRSFGAGGEDAFLLKYDANGQIVWQRTYGTAPDATSAGEETGIGVAVTPDNSGVVVVGNFHDGNIFLARFDHDGNLLWDLTWGGNQEGASGIAIAPDGTIYAAGITFGFNVSQGDAFLISVAAGGTLNWERTWGGEFFDSARDVAVATDGNIYIAGDTRSFSAASGFLVKFAPDGLVLSEREWGLLSKSGIPGETLVGGVAATPDGGACVSGWSFGAGADPNLLVVRFDVAANFIWQKVGGPGFGAAIDVAIGPDESAHVTGNVLPEDEQAFGGNAFVWTLLANGKGNDAALWGGGTTDDQFQGEDGQSIAVASDGTVAVAGIAGAPPYTLTRASKNAKTADMYNLVIAGTVTMPAGVVADPQVVVGTPVGSETFAGVSDAFLLRLQR